MHSSMHSSMHPRGGAAAAPAAPDAAAVLTLLLLLLLCMPRCASLLPCTCKKQLLLVCWFLQDAIAAVAELPGLEAILVNCCSPQVWCICCSSQARCGCGACRSLS